MFKKRIKVILWDFDGTIYHSEDSYREYAKCIESVMKNSDSFANKSMQVIKDKENKVGDDGWAIIANLANGSVTREEMDMCFARTREKMNEGKIKINLQSTAVKILKKQEIRHILLTNTPEKYVIPLLENFGIKNLFYRIVCSAKKPDSFKNVMNDLLTRENIRSEDILSIGDNYKNDIIPSMEMGFKTVFIQNYQRDSKADLTVNQLEDAIPFIENFVKN